MSRIKKVGISLVFGVFFLLFFFSIRPEQAYASAAPRPKFYFRIGGTEVKDGGTVKLNGIVNETDIIVQADDWMEDYTVEWTSSTDVVTLSFTDAEHKNGRLKRNGPGFSTIVATIKTGGYTLRISCIIEIKLEVNWVKTKHVAAKTSGGTDSYVVQLRLSDLPDTQTIYMKYADAETGTGTVSGSPIETGIEFASSDTSVVEVDSKGKLTPKGGGSADITVSSTTYSGSDKPMTAKVRVVVVPTFQISWDENGATRTEDSWYPKSKKTPVRDVPSNFIVRSNAQIAETLKWEVWDCTGQTPKKLSANSAKLEYIVSNVGESVTFRNVKAGTYEIRAYAGQDYTEQSGAVEYAYMRIVVPIRMDDTSIVMQVGDTYDIFKNSNIPMADAFTYTSDNLNIVGFENGKVGVLEAKTKGSTSVICKLVPGWQLYPEGVPDLKDEFIINVRVIDGISLNMSNAKMYVGGTLQLVADITDKTQAVWSSSNEKVATVKDGLITAKAVGQANIIASVTIDGVVKKAICKLLVEKTVTKIELVPSKWTLGIGENLALVAKMTPDNTTVNLVWKSSDEKVVKISKTYPDSATVTGVSGGHAVISAINEDNVVVGYCHITVRQPVTKIELSEYKIVADLNGRLIQLNAIVRPDNAENKEILWSSTDTSKATVDKNGLVTVKKPGTVSIIATSKDSPEVTAVCNIDILIPVNSINLDTTEKVMNVGDTLRLSYTMNPVDASTNSVSWTSTNPRVAAVNGTGLVTAKAPGTAVIILKSEDGGYTSYCTITVKRIAAGIKLDASALNLKTGETYALKATLTPADSTEAKITWETSDARVATVDASGKITAKATGSAIIAAKLETGATVYCKVNVTTPVSGLLMNFTEKTIYKGETLKLKVSVTPSNATLMDVTWTSSNNTIATVDESGEVTAVAGGTAIITCKTKDGGYTANCVLTVREGVTNVSLNHQTYYLGVDKSVTLVATVSSPSATNQEIIWSTSNSKIATVNQKGKVTAKKIGNVTITAMAADGSEAEATCEIQVVKPVESVSLNSSSISLMVGQTRKLKVTVKPGDATLKAAKWTSSDPSVAIVDEEGEIIAVKAGNTTITAEALDNSGKTAICYVVVYERVASTGVTLQDKQIVMVAGEEKVVTSVLTPATTTDKLTWSTDNAAVARVDKNTGRITARAKGVAYITAMTDSGKTAQVEVKVIGLNITELTLEEYTNYKHQLQVEGTDSKVSWSIDNPRVAEVTNGMVSTRGVGKATITATVNGRKLTCKLTVTKIK